MAGGLGRLVIKEEVLVRWFLWGEVVGWLLLLLEEEEVLRPRGEEKAEGEVGEGEVVVGMVGSRREGREEEGGRGEEGVVVAKIEGVGPMATREEEESKVDWWPYVMKY